MIMYVVKTWFIANTNPDKPTYNICTYVVM